MVEISVNEIKHRYGEVIALDNVSLQIRKGELYGLIGPDGAGKTTLMRVLCGLVRPDNGFYAVCGSSDPGAIKRSIGYMPQRFSLYQDLTVSENIRFFARIFSIPRGDYRKRFADLMAFSGLGPFAGRRADKLSGGMKQKLALCCTLIHTPRVLILDEPTTGVDAVSRVEFWNILSKLAGEGVTILVSTPYMDEAMKCHKVSLIHEGQILATDKPRDIPRLFKGNVLEWSGPNIFDRSTQLARLTCVEAVHLFGNRLHVVTGNVGNCLGEIGRETDLPAQDFTRVEPGIEDTFISLLSDTRVQAENS